VRLFDADPRKLDQMAIACWEKAVGGDVPAQTFIRDTMDGKPLQRNETAITTPNVPFEQMTEEQLDARIAELEAQLAAEKAADDSENAGTAH